jgi:uncharacterized protein (TIGR00369 family)
MPSKLDQVRAQMRSKQPLMPITALLGMSLRSAEEGLAVIEYEAAERHANTMGTLHGGVLCTMADTAMGVAFYTALEENESLTTLELKINYLKPVWRGKLTASARVVKRGKTVGLMECDITDEEGQLVARASSTFMAITGEQAVNRTVPHHHPS